MPPLIDMFNYAEASSLDGTLTEGDAVVLRADRHIAKGDEVTVPYGRGRGVPNAQLMMEHGFCRAHNPFDDVALPMQLHDPATPRVEALTRLRLLLPTAPPPRLSRHRDTLPPEAVVFARLATIAPSEAAPLEASKVAADIDGYVRRASRDRGVRRFLRAAITSHLARYETTADEDEALLSQFGHREHKQNTPDADGDDHHAPAPPVGARPTTYTDRLHCAVLLRLEEKRTLEHWAIRLEDGPDDTHRVLQPPQPNGGIRADGHGQKDEV